MLLDELSELRAGQVSQKTIEDLTRALRELDGSGPIEAASTLKTLAQTRFAGAAAALLVRWAPKVKTEADVLALIGHFHRLALVSGVLSAFRRGADRLPRGGG